ncbi:hypothetical protein SADUNF_Sadunf09G0104800 [Salix dunnii]|uniref:Chalcone synthase n=1 Tax=Salix dunnii TaxID=1413687 RepID=A0A835MWL1_9ROSI|nr:hypothetical protein SADUNF_Sadunf09G0104800 [Salix dunnii]
MAPLGEGSEEALVVQDENRKPISSILIIIAMQTEAIPIVNKFQLKEDFDSVFPNGVPWVRYHGFYKDLHINLVWPGKDSTLGVDSVGTISASLVTYAAIQALQPDLIINAGTAGSFKLIDGSFQVKGASISDVFLASDVAFHDRRIPIPVFDLYGVGLRQSFSTPNLLKELNLKVGKLSTGDSLDMSPQEEASIVANDATVKDMEGAAVAYVADLLKVPAIFIKAVTDIVDGEKPTSEEFLQNLAAVTAALDHAVTQVRIVLVQQDRKDVIKASPDKATILALGKAFPHQLDMQEFLVDGYFKNTNCDDLELKQKLTRLRKTTLKTSYVVMSDEVLKKYPKISIEDLPTVKQRLDICNDAVTQMAIDASRVGIKKWGRPFMLYFAGCSGGVVGLRVAKDIAENNSGSRALLATSETTIIGFKPPSADGPYDPVAVALFGNGAEGVIVGNIQFRSLKALSLSFIQQSRISCQTLKRLLMLKGIAGLADKDYNKMFWAVHPGGPAILNRMEKRFDLLPDKLDTSPRAPADYSNASSSNIVCVLVYMIEECRKMEAGSENCDWGLILAFGPGITFEGILARNLAILI